jgi:Metal-dependent hydrolases of the beta-lactamase superfamily I
MSLYVASLNSGSNGNCYYIGNGKDAILVDAGISCRETEKRMARLGLSIKNVRAIFISHEHTDHIKGLPVISRKYNIPVYITQITLQHSRMVLDQQLTQAFCHATPVNIAGIEVTAFTKHHDAADAHSFIISHSGTTVGVFTDIGNVCSNLVQYFKRCHAAFIEANYDVDMLEHGRYPYHLKNRIRGGKGHLSNNEALQLVQQHRTEDLSHVFLSHLSKDNNDPVLAEHLFKSHCPDLHVSVASRYNESEVHYISAHQRQANHTFNYRELHQASLFA